MWRNFGISGGLAVTTMDFLSYATLAATAVSAFFVAVDWARKRHP